MEKYLKKLFNLNGAAPYAGAIRKAIAENKYDLFALYCSSISQKQDEKGRKKLEETVSYFKSNWDSIVERVNGVHCGSCTEPLVSHILSERLSRNPLAWSKEGLEKMAMLRVFKENGGKVTADHIRISRSKTDRTKDHYALQNGFAIYNKYAEKQIKAAFGGKHDWSIFEKEITSSGKVTGTSVVLKAYSHINSLKVS